MNIGFIGLGKLGLPVAQAIHSKGHTVIGYDISDQRMEAARRGELQTGPMAQVAESDIVFVAIQTPHEPQYEGITRLPNERKDFDYSHLMAGLHDLVGAIRRGGTVPVVAIISTVLPGTTDAYLRPILKDVPFVYNPSFIAMGTVERDYLHPEFVLLGVDRQDTADRLVEFYNTVVDAPIYKTTVRNAELIKVAYNTFIGLKLAFVNTLMEICHKTGCDVDAVTDALKMADKRLISPAYFTAGMGDGGACHPRDNIALSWLAKELGLSYDLFEAVMMSREKQAEWLAELMCQYDLPKFILGTAYKAGTAIETGSHALLVKRILEERGHLVGQFDPHADAPWGGQMLNPFVTLIGCKHPEFFSYKFPPGTVIIDPWRYIPEQPGITVIGLGRPRDPVLPGVRQPASR